MAAVETVAARPRWFRRRGATALAAARSSVGVAIIGASTGANVKPQLVEIDANARPDCTARDVHDEPEPSPGQAALV